MLNKSAQLLVPSALHDGFVHLVARGSPGRPVGGERALVGQAWRAIHGDPAHDLRVHKIAWSTAHLPNGLVFILPVLANPIGKPAQVDPELVRDRGRVFVIEVERVHQLAVDIELELLGGSVSDADGAGSFVPFPMIERNLGQIVTPVNSVHRL